MITRCHSCQAESSWVKLSQAVNFWTVDAMWCNVMQCEMWNIRKLWTTYLKAKDILLFMAVSGDVECIFCGIFWDFIFFLCSRLHWRQESLIGATCQEESNKDQTLRKICGLRCFDLWGWASTHHWVQSWFEKWVASPVLTALLSSQSLSQTSMASRRPGTLRTDGSAILWHKLIDQYLIINYIKLQLKLSQSSQFIFITIDIYIY